MAHNDLHWVSDAPIEQKTVQRDLWYVNVITTVTVLPLLRAATFFRLRFCRIGEVKKKSTITVAITPVKSDDVLQL